VDAYKFDCHEDGIPYGARGPPGAGSSASWSSYNNFMTQLAKEEFDNCRLSARLFHKPSA